MENWIQWATHNYGQTDTHFLCQEEENKEEEEVMIFPQIQN